MFKTSVVNVLGLTYLKGILRKNQSKVIKDRYLAQNGRIEIEAVAGLFPCDEGS